jgi:hypothetical protein
LTRCIVVFPNDFRISKTPDIYIKPFRGQQTPSYIQCDNFICEPMKI